MCLYAYNMQTVLSITACVAAPRCESAFPQSPLYIEVLRMGIFTRCAYAQGRVKRLSPSIYIYVCLCVCVCVVKKHGCLLSYRSKIATK